MRSTCTGTIGSWLASVNDNSEASSVANDAFSEGEQAPAKATASAVYTNWGAYVTSEVNSGAEWMAKMRNMMLYRDALIQ